MDLRRDTALDAGMRDELARVIADLEQQWPQLPPPIVLSCSDRPVVGLDGGTPWLYAFADPTPCAARTGTPSSPVGSAGSCPDRGGRSQFDAVAVAHELDVNGPVRSLMAELADGPRTCTDEVARALVGPVPAHPGVSRAAGMLARSSAASPGVGGAALDRLLDPIVFGVVAPYGLAHGLPGVFQPLVAWKW